MGLLVLAHGTEFFAVVLFSSFSRQGWQGSFYLYLRAVLGIWIFKDPDFLSESRPELLLWIYRVGLGEGILSIT